ncbi:condensation domain-containing protein [Myxococcus landrumensis]|uniref:condensation domain-containing protein n=1 Tax=Myxococcus landrumensis TaxID=2813577 RepID=UPI0035309193
MANRNRSETEGLIGFFVNTLVFRSRFQGVRSFRELLAQVRLNTLAAYEHQGRPLREARRGAPASARPLPLSLLSRSPSRSRTRRKESSRSQGSP